MKNFKMYNGVEIPHIGFGTWQVADGEEAYNSCIWALKAGYRHIDTAYAYENEKTVGKAIKDSGTYSALSIFSENPILRKVISSLMDGTWHENRNEFRVIVDDLLYKNDEYLLLQDFESYRLAQEQINTDYQDRLAWARKCLINIANSAYFSSDRTIQQYVDEIWKLEKAD